MPLYHPTPRSAPPSKSVGPPSFTPTLPRPYTYQGVSWWPCRGGGGGFGALRTGGLLPLQPSEVQRTTPSLALGAQGQMKSKRHHPFSSPPPLVHTHAQVEQP